MDGTGKLVSALRDGLRPCGYSEFAEGDVGGVEFAGVLSTPKGGSRRLLCAVAPMPATVRDAAGARRLLGRIRRVLARRYHRGLPWPRRLGTYVVFLCDPAVREALAGREGDLIDTSGLHVNVLLGAVLIDRRTFRSHGEFTWGLLEVGDQFQRIQSAVDGWCRERRHRLRLEPTSAQVLSVA